MKRMKMTVSSLALGCMVFLSVAASVQAAPIAGVTASTVTGSQAPASALVDGTKTRIKK